MQWVVFARAPDDRLSIMYTVLDVSQLALGINKNRVIAEGINFTLHNKEFMAIIGPNGCGKSSLIRTLMGEIDIIDGSIHFLSEPLLSYNQKIRSQYIALMGQSITVDPHMRVIEFISLGRYPHFHHSTRQYDAQCVGQIIEELNLQHLAGKYVSNLSGGEFQRANLARVLAQEPKLLLLDEPTNHLDPKAKIELLEIIRSRQIATIAVLHDLHLVEYFSDKVMILNHGKMQVCDHRDNALSSHWIKDTFGLSTFEIQHPESTRMMKFFGV